MTVKSFIRRHVPTNSSREYLRHYNEAFGADTKPGMVVLDAGAGEQPYRDIFRDCQYESTDFEMADKPYPTSAYACTLVAGDLLAACRTGQTQCESPDGRLLPVGSCLQDHRPGLPEELYGAGPQGGQRRRPESLSMKLLNRMNRS